MSNWGYHFDRMVDMGFTWVYINPVSYPGFSGSLYSVKDYYRLHPLLLDGSDIPETEQLRAMIMAAHERGLKVMFDLVINHTAIDCPLVSEHPDWYKSDEWGKIKNPEVWEGDKFITSWGDLAEINNDASPDREGLWNYWKELVSYHIDLGVDGFRCDAAYQITTDLWKYLIFNAKQKSWQVAFFAETLGCELDETLALSEAGFDMVFNSSKWWDFKEPWCLEQNEETFAHVPSISFPESHDTPRLAEEMAGNEAALKMHYQFSSFFSTGVMIPVGFEFGFRKALNVVETFPQDWEEISIDLRNFIRRVNTLKMTTAILHEDALWTPVALDNAMVGAWVKSSPNLTQKALVIINTDHHSYQHAFLNPSQVLGAPLELLYDISPEYGMEDVPMVLDYWLRPAQVMVFVTSI